MKPFNLEAALQGEPVVTRGGQRVIEIVHFKTLNQTQLPIRFVLDRDGLAVVRSCSIKGTIYLPTGREMRDRDDAYDLFMAPKITTLWVNVYTNDVRYVSGRARLYKSEAEANSGAQIGADGHDYRIGKKAHKIVIEE